MLYTAASLLCLFIQSAVFQRLTIWGVIPFVYPALAAIPATYEGPVPGTIIALATGVVCDLLLPDASPCFYTLVFPLAGLCGGLLAQSLLPAGLLCSLASTAAAFFLTDAAHCLLLWMHGKAAWEAGAFLALRELCVTAPLVLPMTALFRAMHILPPSFLSDCVAFS
jgi:hypothetical protein